MHDYVHYFTARALLTRSARICTLIRPAVVLMTKEEAPADTDIKSPLDPLSNCFVPEQQERYNRPCHQHQTGPIYSN